MYAIAFKEEYFSEAILILLVNSPVKFPLKKDKVLPIYKLISNTGPRHNPIFKVAVKLKNTRFIEGSGSSKKNAEQSAAEQLFKMYKDELAR